MTVPAGKFSDHLSDVYFSDLRLPHAVSAGIAGCGFIRATPIQAATLPLLLAGQDVAAQAQTGTGKTAAYLVAIFTRFVRTKRHKASPNPRALIVAPTRELAVQIQEDAKALGHFLKPRIVTVFGGIDYGRQRDQLRAGCDLLIGTPGRLLDYEQQGATSFGEVESLVVDEADRLFDLGFIKDLRRILRRCPPPGRRHSMLFSATLSLRVMELAYEHLNDARKIEIRPEQITADRVTQVLYHVSQREKIPLLLNLLRREGVDRTMLFVNTKRFAERLVSNLERHGFKIGALTGDIPQPRRLKILQDFKSGVLPLLVATDVASRGLHIDGVTHVINVDLPQDPEDYVHRIGRTARAGQAGKAISLADEDYVFSLDAIQRLIGMKIPVEFADDLLFAAPKPAASKIPRSEEEKTAPPAPKISSRVEEKRKEAAPVPTPSQEPERVSEREPAAAFPPPFEEIPVLLSSSVSPVPLLAESSSESPVPADFWTREAFGLAVPQGGFGNEPPEPPPAPAGPGGAPKRRKRRRGRRVAGRVEAVAPA
ncbi:MAG: DEAD/DEAH box helicase [Acidobacteriota bacterium]